MLLMATAGLTMPIMVQQADAQPPTQKSARPVSSGFSPGFVLDGYAELYTGPGAASMRNSMTPSQAFSRTQVVANPMREALSEQEEEEDEDEDDEDTDIDGGDDEEDEAEGEDDESDESSDDTEDEASDPTADGLSATIGGDFTIQAGLGGDLARDLRFRNKAEIDVNVGGKTDEGLRYGARIQFL
jgi:hypothetical protein